MKDKISVLLVGRSKPGVDSLEGMLQGQPGIELRVRRVDNGYVDPLYGVPSLPDVLVLDLSHLWEDELRALSLRQGAQRAPLIAIGPGGDTRIMRMAMQAGARDFYTHPVPAEELLTAIHRTGQKETTVKGSVSAIINAKGGSGASFVACSLAQILVSEMRHRVALVDLDLQ
ncbi:MAG: AAA family ATPase, partial [bacterium]